MKRRNWIRFGNGRADRAAGAAATSARRRTRGVRAAAVLILGATLALPPWVPDAGSAEVIPAIGLSRATEREDAEFYGSLAFRGELAPVLRHEIGIAYRSESRFDDRLNVRMWPITASLWLSPVPGLYAGGGVGFYQVTYDYDQEAIPFDVKDDTDQEFGVHLGGGFNVPLSPKTAIDLNGRYVMMREQESRLVPEEFDPDFWNVSLGLAFRM